jgi:hypothetical protein
VLAMPGIHGDCFTHGNDIVWDTMAFQIRSDHRYYNVALDCWDRFSGHFITSLFVGSGTGLLVCYAMPCCYYTVSGNVTIFFRQNNFFFFRATAIVTPITLVVARAY